MPLSDLLKTAASLTLKTFGASAFYVGYQASGRQRANTGDDTSKYQPPGSSPSYRDVTKVAPPTQQTRSS